MGCKQFIKVKNILFLCVIIYLLFTVVACKKTESPGIGKTVADKPLPSEGFKAQIQVIDPPSSVKVNSLSIIPVKVKNISSITWPSKGMTDGRYLVRLGFRWFDKRNNMVLRGRTNFPNDIKPNEEVTLKASVMVPNTPGEYILEFDMVQEQVAWFKDKGSKPARLNIEVK